MDMVSNSVKPCSDDVLAHPFFWPPHKIYNFIQVSYQFMKRTDRKMKRQLEIQAELVVEQNWIPKIKGDVDGNFEEIKGNKIQDLLKFMEYNVSSNLNFSENLNLHILSAVEVLQS